MNSNIKEMANEIIDNELNGTTRGGALGGISSFVLKMIAMGTMLVDHIAAVFLATYIINRQIVQDGAQGYLIDIYYFLRGVGRMAFPLFAFMLVQGFIHTGNRKKYAFRLFIFALLSEIPFDLAFNGEFFYFDYNNVFWTLLLGLITIMLLDWIKHTTKLLDTSKSFINWIGVNLLRCVGMTTIILISMCLAEFILKCDYTAGGVAAIIVLYFLKDYRKCSFIAAVALLGLVVDSTEWLALLMIIPVSMYNGTRGPKNQKGFYLFYPAHLLILGILK